MKCDAQPIKVLVVHAYGLQPVSELWPPAGLLFIPQMIYECAELQSNDTDRGKPKK
jgi:hypothetical protein